MRVLIASLLLVGHVAAGASATDKRLAPPEAAAIESSRKEINEIFAKDIEKAKTATIRKDLAVRSLSAANDSKESPANRWVLYLQARDLAAAAGDVQFTLGVVHDFAKAFEIKRNEVIADAAEKLAKAAVQPSPRALYDLAVAEADQAIDADEYPSAVKLLTIAVRVAPALKDAIAARRVEARLQQVKEFAKAFDDARGIDEHMGKFQCFRKGNWEKGLALLANSQNESLAAVVEKDMAKPTDANDVVDLGNAWFELSEKTKGDERLAMMRRAFYWLIGGVGNTSGLVKAKAESRISKVIAEVEDVDIKDGRFTLLAGRWKIAWNNGVTWEMTISTLGRVDQNRDIAPNGSVTDPNVQGYEYLARKHGNVTAKKGEAFALYKNGEVIDVYRVSTVGIAVDRYNPGSMFPKKVDVAGKVTPLR